MRSRRGDVVLITLAMFASLPAIGDWGVLSPDSFAYLQTARTIRDTGHLPEAAMMRPPGYPLVLAGLLSFDEIPFLAARLFNVMCLCATALLTRELLRRPLGDRGAWLAAALVATSPALLRQQIVLLSEPLFTPLALGGLILLEKWHQSRRMSWGDAVLAGFLVSSACLCRSTGMVLLPISLFVLLRLLWRSPRETWPRAAVYCVLAFGPIVAYQAHQRAYPTTHSYSQMWFHARGAEHSDATGLALQAERLGRFGPQRLADLKEAVAPVILGWRLFAPPFDRPATWLIGGLCGAVAGFRLLRDLSIIDAFFLLSMAMLALWPWDEGVRLVSPLTPLLLGYLVWIAVRLWKSGWLRGSKIARGILLSIIALGCLVQAAELALTQSRLRDRASKERSRYADMQDLAQWLEQNADPNVAWTGVARDGNPTKVLLLGAAYLSHTKVTTVDVAEKATYDCTPLGPLPTIAQADVASNTPQECATIPMSSYSGVVAYGFAQKKATHAATTQISESD